MHSMHKYTFYTAKASWPVKIKRSLLMNRYVLLLLTNPVSALVRQSDPSPGPPRLVKAPAAVHPLPKGEG